MIVLSVGMPRAGSAWHYNLIHDLMKTTGCADAHDIREKYGLNKILTEVNSNIGVLSARRLGMVSVPALLGNTFVIKAHAGPTNASRLLSTVGLLRITYIYRDPRDAMLSAYDFGQRALAKGQPNAFSHLSDFEKCADFMMQYVHVWEKWMDEKNVLIARYEELLTNYDEESAKLVNYLKLDGNMLAVRAVIEQYRPGANDGQSGLHFFKGKIGRFREAYHDAQKQVLKEKLAKYLPRMGYEAE
ncbi:MAG: sulfotransferase domain-containing protein [Anaerolineales bacterium]|nr:sulfotransferase domain-containing protein [Anaerolineales bacterium]MDP2777441.1 sulfotransferase domain-containing protein [Anaerolineales bacterium]